MTVDVELRGRASLPELAAELHEIDGIVNVRAGEAINELDNS